VSADLPPEARLWQLARGFMTTQALHVATALGVADELAKGPMPIDELARRTGADSDALYRFLRALASEGVFAEEEPRAFRNTSESDLLRRGADGAWREFTLLFGTICYQAFGEAPHAARTGDETFSRVFDVDFWSRLAQNPAERDIFDRAMQGGAEGRVGRLAELPWRDGETVVDVGGGNGTLLIELLHRHSGLNGVVFDLPEVAREAETHVADSGLGQRLRVVAGSMFDSVPTGGDAYVLAVVLHDWDDAGATKILQRIREAVPDHARLVVLDAVLEPGNEPSDGRKWLDLLMLVLNRGRERTAEEWHSLLGGAGFRVEQFGENLIEAVPA